MFVLHRARHSPNAIALNELRRAFIAVGWAVAGALLGGSGLWLAAYDGHAPALLHAFEKVPGIRPALIAETGRAFYDQGPVAMYAGALLGRPYKLYAVHAGAQSVPFLSFITTSALARAARFALATLAAWAMGRALARYSESVRTALHALFWVGFYAVYFAMMR